MGHRHTPAVSRAALSRAVLPVLLGLLLPAGTWAGEDDSLAALDQLEPLSNAVLEASHAKAALEVHKIQINDQELNGVVSENVATNVETGNNTVENGAYMGSTGFMTTIQNTGNNVLIQNATIINVAVEP